MPIWMEEEEGRGRRALDLERRRTSIAGWWSGGEERTCSVLEDVGKDFFRPPPTLDDDLLYGTKVDSFCDLFNETEGLQLNAFRAQIVAADKLYALPPILFRGKPAPADVRRPNSKGRINFSYLFPCS
jgi:hypothetical protein